MSSERTRDILMVLLMVAFFGLFYHWSWQSDEIDKLRAQLELCREICETQREN